MTTGVDTAGTYPTCDESSAVTTSLVRGHGTRDQAP